MNLLLIHNYYQQSGGEDAVFTAEAKCLRQYGNTVLEYKDYNSRIKNMSSLTAAAETIWSRPSHRRLVKVLNEVRPDVAHFHNTFMLISPSVYYACQEFNIPVVQTLHNYRLICPAATFYRDGHLCEDCLGKRPPLPGVLRGCYHDSRMHTALVASMVTVHHLMKTWQTQIDIFIALSQFSKMKFIEGGIPSETIYVKPNFVYPDPGARAPKNKGNYVLFVGRISPEKGINTLVKAWQGIREIPLKIIGTGPLMRALQDFVQDKRNKNIEIAGHRTHEEVLNLIKGARFLVLPSECYENFPIVIAEAFACGVPIIVSRLGAMAEIVEDGRTGLHFESGNPEDLSVKVEWAWMHTKRVQEMGCEARIRYESKYTAEHNYKMLMDIYQLARERRGRG